MTQTIETSAPPATDQRYVLYIQADNETQGGSWHFELFDNSGEKLLEATGSEADGSIDRLALLGTVRALESLDGPARVTLAGTSRYVSHGLRFGLPRWREQGWRWECFGQLVPIRHGDLWQRLDRALHYHRVETVSVADKGLRLTGDAQRTIDDGGVLKTDDDAKMRMKPPLEPISPRRSDNQHRRAPVRPNRPPAEPQRSSVSPQGRLQQAIDGIKRMAATVSEMTREWFESKSNRALLGVDR